MNTGKSGVQGGECFGSPLRQIRLRKPTPDPIPGQACTTGWKAFAGLAVGIGILILAAFAAAGSTIIVPNTYYQIHTCCSNYTLANLKYAVNQVWGPYYYSFGGSLPSSMKTLVVSYRYNCSSSYNNCSDKEEYYFGQRYGLVQWVHYTLSNGSYVQQQKSVFNELASGSATPYFPCF